MQLSVHAELVDSWLRFVSGSDADAEVWSDEDLVLCLKV